MNIIECKYLSKKYRSNSSIFRKNINSIERFAIQDIEMSIKKGDFVGLIGHNGAGKSTLIKLMTGLIKPTQGNIRVLGKDPFRHRIENNWKISVMFGQRSQLKWDLPPRDYYELLKNIYQINEETFNARLNEYIDSFNLEKIIDRPVRSLSLGQRMKCEIVASFINQPEIVFLDEPTIGLDINSKEEIVNFLRKQRDTNNITLIITSHDLEEIGKIAKKIIILAEGKKIYDGRTEEINDYRNINSVKLSTDGEFVLGDICEENIKYLDNNSVLISKLENTQLNSYLKFLIENNSIRDIEIIKETFSETIKKIMESDFVDK